MTMNGMITSGNINVSLVPEWAHNRKGQQDSYKDCFHPDFSLHLRGLIFRIM